MSPRARQRIRTIAELWLAWTVAGLFYITQDSVPRLYRGEAVPWKYVFVGWMTAMYICAAFTPALLWLGNRWPLERRVWYAGFHAVLQHRFLDRVHRRRSPAADGARRLPGRVATSVGGRRYPSDAVVRPAGWRRPVLGGHRAPGRVPSRSENAKIREREAFELKVQASELAQQLAVGAAERAEDAAAAALPLQHAGRHHGAHPAAEDGRGRNDGRAARRPAAPCRSTTWMPRKCRCGASWSSCASISRSRRSGSRTACGCGSPPILNLSDALVPHMVLQPLVENAVRHGLGQSEEAVTIDVTRVEARWARSS